MMKVYGNAIVYPVFFRQSSSKASVELVVRFEVDTNDTISVSYLKSIDTNDTILVSSESSYRVKHCTLI